MQSLKEKIKKLVMDEAKTFCELINEADDPPSLDYSIETDGVRVRIIAGKIDKIDSKAKHKGENESIKAKI